MLGQSKIEPAVQLIASILQIFLLSIVVSLKLWKIILQETKKIIRLSEVVWQLFVAFSSVGKLGFARAGGEGENRVFSRSFFKSSFFLFFSGMQLGFFLLIKYGCYTSYSTRKLTDRCFTWFSCIYNFRSRSQKLKSSSEGKRTSSLNNRRVVVPYFNLFKNCLGAKGVMC